MRNASQTRAAIAANRFGLGARPGELEAIGSDPDGWLAAQLGGARPLPPELAALPPSPEPLAAAQSLQRQRARGGRSGAALRTAREMMRDLRREGQQSYLDGAAARTLVAVRSAESFRERLVHFWSNHFSVSVVGEPLLPGVAVPFENEAIRPHVTGRFVDLLLAVESHPAMLIYLDNQGSIGPRSRLARRMRGRKRGLNENLAREILELHTLGVDGGYTQDDVTTFAEVLTGWSVGRGNRRLGGGRSGRFTFLAAAHEPGRKTLLGKTYPDGGVEQGVAVLRDLAAHPATARFVAAKLARHFAADDPPGALTERLARVFRETDGDLGRVSLALIESSEVWALRAAKLKTPQELVVSAYRAVGAEPSGRREGVGSLALLGQRPLSAPSPAGWGDTAASWDGADALLRRIEWGVSFADRHPSTGPVAVANSALGALAGAHTQTAVARAQSRSQGLALLLASPEFQRR